MVLLPTQHTHTPLYKGATEGPRYLSGVHHAPLACAGVVFNTSTLHDVIVMQALATLDRLIITCKVTDYHDNAAGEYPRAEDVAAYDVVCVV